MSKNLQIPLEQQQRILELHDQGKTLDEISWELRLHKGLLETIVKRGIPSPRKSRPKRCGGCGSLIVTEYCVGCLIALKKRTKRLCDEETR